MERANSYQPIKKEIVKSPNASESQKTKTEINNDNDTDEEDGDEEGIYSRIGSMHSLISDHDNFREQFQSPSTVRAKNLNKLDKNTDGCDCTLF